jgi:hypothetical protein
MQLINPHSSVSRTNNDNSRSGQFGPKAPGNKLHLFAQLPHPVVWSSKLKSVSETVFGFEVID